MLDGAACCCRTLGSPATTRWAAAHGSASSCGRGASAICWPCRRTRRCGTCSLLTRRTRPGPSVTTARPSCVWTTGAAGVAEGAWQTVEVRAAEKRPGAGAGRVDAGASANRGPGVGRGRGPGGLPEPGKATAHGSTTTCCPTRRRRPPWRSTFGAGVQGGAPDRGVPCSGPKGKRVWRTTRSAPGGGGITTRPWALAAAWFLTMETRRGKKWTPALTATAGTDVDRGGAGATAGDGAVGVPASRTHEPAFTAVI